MIKKFLALCSLSLLLVSCSHQQAVYGEPKGFYVDFDDDDQEDELPAQAIIRTTASDTKDEIPDLSDEWRANYFKARKTPEMIQAPVLEGYAEQISYYPGETLKLMVDSRSVPYRIEISRYGEKSELMFTSDVIQPFKQVTKKYAFKDGCDWKPVLSHDIPRSWDPGIYSAKLIPVPEGITVPFYITFIVKRSELRRPKKILVLSSTNTWNAYNPWGGSSVYHDYRSYKDQSDPKAGRQYTLVHYQRPNYETFPIGNEGHLASGELHVLKWLERNHYDYDLISDLDLHRHPEILKRHKVVILNTHPEYESRESFDALEYFVKSGGKLINLSGNGVYAKVTFKDYQMETFRKYSGGGTHTQNGDKGGLWTAPLKRSEATLLGTRYMVDLKHAEAKPYLVLKPQHWVFEGTHLKLNDKIGEHGLNSLGGAASGWETDQIDPKYSPKNIELLARGAQGEVEGAAMVYYRNWANGEVFSVGSINFGGSLAVDPMLSRIVSNVLDRFLKK